MNALKDVYGTCISRKTRKILIYKSIFHFTINTPKKLSFEKSEFFLIIGVLLNECPERFTRNIHERINEKSIEVQV